MNEQIICKPLDLQYIEIAVEMVQENYNLERQSVPALYNLDNKDFYYSKLEQLFINGIGRIAFRDGEPVGFLAFNPFTGKNGIKGGKSPLYGYGIRNEERGKVIGKLFQSVAAELCENYAQNLQVSIYAHDRKVLNMYMMSAFSMELTNVIRNTSDPISSDAPSEFEFGELNKAQVLEYRSDVLELYRSLINHLRLSPVFYHCREFMPIEDRFEDFLSEEMRIFAVFHEGHLIGMIDSEPTDIDFAKSDKKSLGMGDVFIKPDYRSCGLGQALLDYANCQINKSGIDRIYVTHGTINPTARGFWDKYFTNFSYTMTRQIDPQMLGKIDLI